MSNIQNQMSGLAKLMATENLTVQHAKVPTASFDPKNRILTCPIWEQMSGDLYDLLMGHEVGHALDTPADGWHGAADQFPGGGTPHRQRHPGIGRQSADGSDCGGLRK